MTVIEAQATLSLRPAGLLRLADLTHGELMGLLAAGLRAGGGAGPVDSVEAAILDHAVGKATWTPPASYWLGASTTTPTDAAGNFTEPGGGVNYGRVEIVTADWNAASGTAPVVVTNVNAVAFGAATGSWGTITHVGLFAASSGGSPQWFGALSASAAVNTGGTLSFASSQIVLQLGEPSDTYT